MTQKRKRGKCPKKKCGDQQTWTGTDFRKKSSLCWGFVPLALWNLNPPRLPENSTQSTFPSNAQWRGLSCEDGEILRLIQGQSEKRTKGCCSGYTFFFFSSFPFLLSFSPSFLLSFFSFPWNLRHPQSEMYNPRFCITLLKMYPVVILLSVGLTSIFRRTDTR